MRKLLMIFFICTLSILGITLCYSDLQANAAAAFEDLPLVQKYEPAEDLKMLNRQFESMQAVLAGQINSINTLDLIYYTGMYINSFDGKQIYDSLRSEVHYSEKHPFMDSDVYRGYYDIRTSKLKKAYESFDYQAFVKSSREVFNGYIKTKLKNTDSVNQLILQLQGKLTDKLPELEPSKRKIMLEEILALRQTLNEGLALEHVYQVFESRVRLQLLDEMVELNKKKLEGLTEKIGLIIISKESGKLLIKNQNPQSKDGIVEILNVLENMEGYRGVAKLKELYNRQEGILLFSGPTTNKQIRLDKALQAIVMNEDGYLQLDLDALNSEEVPAQITPSIAVKTSAESQLKAMEQLYTSKTKAAQGIVKELNRYSIYLELKAKKLSNYYTRDFELKQKNWRKDLDSKLNTFGPGGMADFMAYIKNFELLDRSISKQPKEKSLIARFRSSDIQFRKTDEGSKWILDILFKLRYMQ